MSRYQSPVGTVDMVTCTDCGALVLDLEAHDRWHDGRQKVAVYGPGFNEGLPPAASDSAEALTDRTHLATALRLGDDLKAAFDSLLRRSKLGGNEATAAFAWDEFRSSVKAVEVTGRAHVPVAKVCTCAKPLRGTESHSGIPICLRCTYDLPSVDERGTSGGGQR